MPSGSRRLAVGFELEKSARPGGSWTSSAGWFFKMAPRVDSALGATRWHPVTPEPMAAAGSSSTCGCQCRERLLLRSLTDLSQINATNRLCLIVKELPPRRWRHGSAPPRPTTKEGGTVFDFFPEVTMSHWRRSHEPSYFADWLIVWVVMLALLLIVLGAR
jgi:hypothetical protein